ncbi:MAG: glycosyltransferase family 2 protein [Desulfuromonadales bacterium]|nr:glycosyltransferase family 2 protein [Desulfuromonadales bacterium]
MLLIFWLTFVLLAYTYLGYPALLLLWRKIAGAKEPVREQLDSSPPRVSVLVAAHNEAQAIGARLDNLLEQDYPADRVEIIVVSDGSTDATAEVVEQYRAGLGEEGSYPEIKLCVCPQRRGKAHALNLGMEQALGQIVVFADCRQRFERNAVQRLVENFNDPAIGGVSGELLLESDNDSEIGAAMGAYWHYEKWVRKLEAATGSVVGATGAIYAIRRQLYRPLPEQTLLDDVLTPIYIVGQGFRLSFDPSAKAYDEVSKTLTREWQRKVRTLAGNWQLFSLLKNDFAALCPGFLLRIVSHKFLRLLGPLFLCSLLLSSLLLADVGYRLFALLQLSCYGMALWAKLHHKGREFLPARICLIFVSMNLAAAVGLYALLRGRAGQVWTSASQESGE